MYLVCSLNEVGDVLCQVSSSLFCTRPFWRMPTCARNAGLNRIRNETRTHCLYCLKRSYDNYRLRIPETRAQERIFPTNGRFVPTKITKLTLKALFYVTAMRLSKKIIQRDMQISQSHMCSGNVISGKDFPTSIFM